MPRMIGASHLIHTLFGLLSDATRFIVLGLRSGAALRAENLFLRKQLALYIERGTKPRRGHDAARLALVLLSKLFAWRDALVVVKPETLIGWHRKGFRLFWRWKSKPRGRPRIPADLRKLIANIAERNRPGARSASLMNYCSNWGSGSRPVP
jgi:putative transposase